MNEIIRIQDLNFSYGRKKVFSSFSMSIKKGSFVAVVGPNKSGKTTLTKLIAGLLPSKDSIVLKHQYLDSKEIKDTASTIGIVLSDVENGFFKEEVYQELAFPLENLHYPKGKIEKRIKEVCAFLGIENLLDKRTSRLTSSEKKKIFFALSLLHRPKLLLLDNPFAGFTEEEREKYLHILKELNEKEKMTILLFSNNLKDALESSYLYILNDGKIMVEGSPLLVMQEEKILNQIGLELPFMVDLSLKLQFYEVFDHMELDMDRMVNTLWK